MVSFDGFTPKHTDGDIAVYFTKANVFLMHRVPAHPLGVYDEKSLSILDISVRKADLIPEWTI